MAVIREGAVRGLGLRPYPVQLMGALAMCQGAVAEMATGEGKTLTAALAATLWGWGGRPVHIITVNDYLVGRDAEEMGAVYKACGLRCGHVTHETTPQERVDHYRRDVVYVTSKELVADFLRDQIMLGTLRSSCQTQVGMLMSGANSGRLQVPGLFRVIVDEADSLLIDEAVTPLIISNSPTTSRTADLYRAADELAQQLEVHRDFTARQGGQADRPDRPRPGQAEELERRTGVLEGQAPREELVTQALTARYCFNRDEQYLVTADQKVQIIDEFTGRSWPTGRGGTGCTRRSR
jgi:preprotein translocase subunit SecA